MGDVLGRNGMGDGVLPVKPLAWGICSIFVRVPGQQIWFLQRKDCVRAWWRRISNKMLGVHALGG